MYTTFNTVPAGSEAREGDTTPPSKIRARWTAHCKHENVRGVLQKGLRHDNTHHDYPVICNAGTKAVSALYVRASPSVSSRARQAQTHAISKKGRRGGGGHTACPSSRCGYMAASPRLQGWTSCSTRFVSGTATKGSQAPAIASAVLPRKQPGTQQNQNRRGQRTAGVSLPVRDLAAPPTPPRVPPTACLLVTGTASSD